MPNPQRDSALRPHRADKSQARPAPRSGSRFSPPPAAGPLEKKPAARRRPHNAASTRPDLCWGRAPVLTLLQTRPELCRSVTLAEGADAAFRAEIAQLCTARRVPVSCVPRAELDDLTEGSVHQGVAAFVTPPPPVSLDSVTETLSPSGPSLIVLLDHCQDPHNLGAVVRTAEIAGAACVICQNDRSATVTGTVVKTSAGAVFRLPVVQAVNVARTLAALKEHGFWVVGLDHNTSESIWDAPLPERCVLVVGSEGSGISALTAKNCDKLVKIPMAGRTGSLNAGVAAAVAMFEWARLNGCDASRGTK